MHRRNFLTLAPTLLLPSVTEATLPAVAAPVVRTELGSVKPCKIGKLKIEYDPTTLSMEGRYKTFRYNVTEGNNKWRCYFDLDRTDKHRQDNFLSLYRDGSPTRPYARIHLMRYRSGDFHANGDWHTTSNFPGPNKEQLSPYPLPFIKFPGNENQLPQPKLVREWIIIGIKVFNWMMAGEELLAKIRQHIETTTDFTLISEQPKLPYGLKELPKKGKKS